MTHWPLEEFFVFLNFRTHALACCHAPSYECHFAVIMPLFSAEANGGGYYVYRDTCIWATVAGEEMPCQREDGNRADSFAVAVVRGEAACSEEDIISLLSLSNTGVAQSFVE